MLAHPNFTVLAHNLPKAEHVRVLGNKLLLPTDVIA